MVKQYKFHSSFFITSALQLKLTALLFFLIPTNTNCSAQIDSSFQFIKTIPGHFVSFEVDKLDNVFLIDENNQLKKINSRGDSMGVFNDVKKYGNLSYLDVSNPLKILLYYKNFASIVTLDRYLGIRNSINLRKEHIFSVNCLATSYDNNIWIFDEQEYQLKKINEEGKSLQQTVDIRLLLNETISPSTIIDHENFVYLYDPEQGFYIFDYFGSYKNKLSFLHWTDVSISNNTLYGFFNNQLETYQLGSLRLKEYPLPTFFSSSFSIKAINGKLYVLREAGIDIYAVH